MPNTEEEIYVGRAEDGSIYGTWSVRQWQGQEKKLADDPEVVAFSDRPARRPDEPKPTSRISDDPRLAEPIERG